MKKFIYIFLLTSICFGVLGCSGNSKNNITASDLLTAFKEADLPVVDEKEVTAETDTNNSVGRPGECIEKFFFNDERIKDEQISQSSIIEVFKNAKEMKAKKDFYEKATEKINLSSVKFYTYSADNVLLRISSKATPDIAAEYEKVFMEYAK